MKTWQCGQCGNSYQLSDDREGRLTCGCGEPIAKPNGVILGNGGYSIWEDGELRWSGSAMDAVEFVRERIEAKDDLK